MLLEFLLNKLYAVVDAYSVASPATPSKGKLSPTYEVCKLIGFVNGSIGGGPWLGGGSGGPGGPGGSVGWSGSGSVGGSVGGAVGGGAGGARDGKLSNISFWFNKLEFIKFLK